uniref:Uncharacterized protein n=1 Tax=Arundo donax TaxID=35708 RepID=A0A0A8XXS6_ARUDO
MYRYLMKACHIFTIRFLNKKPSTSV